MNGTHSTHRSPPLAPIAVSAFAPGAHSVGPFVWSFLTHLTIFLGVLVWLKFDANNAHILGEAGLAGAPGKRGTVMIEVSSPQKKQAPEPVAPRERVAEKIPAHLPRELPRELPTRLKSEIKSETRATTTTSSESSKPSSSMQAPTSNAVASASTAPGEGGQNGTGSTPTKNAIGNSDRSNALGIHLKAIREAIQKNLRRPGFRLSDGSKTTSLRMKIAPSGELLDVEIHLSSGDPRLDQLAILAVKRAAPFRPYATELAITIPAIFKGDSFR